MEYNKKYHEELIEKFKKKKREFIHSIEDKCVKQGPLRSIDSFKRYEQLGYEKLPAYCRVLDNILENSEDMRTYPIIRATSLKEDDEVYAYLSEIFSNLQSIPKIKEIPLRANGINNRTSKFESKIEFLKKLLSSFENRGSSSYYNSKITWERYNLLKDYFFENGTNSEELDSKTEKFIELLPSISYSEFNWNNLKKSKVLQENI